MTDLCNILTQIVESYPDSPIWIAGDINLSNIDWLTASISNNAYPAYLCDPFLNFLHEYGFTQTVNFPTRGNNTLDIFVTNRPSLISSCKPVSGISDHEAVIVISSLKTDLQLIPKRRIYNWKRADWNEIKDKATYFCNFFITNFDTGSPINSLWNEFKEFCLSILEIIPSKFTTNHSYPWITHSIKKLSRRKQRLYNQARLSHHPKDWELYYQIKKECQRECRKAYNTYVESLIDGNNVSKKMWSYIKSKKTDYCGIAPLQQNGTTYTDSKDKATILNNYFASIFVSEDGPMPTLADNSYPDISPLLINNEGVTALLLNLKDHKASGPDEIPTTLLKRLAIEISPVLTMIFQASLHQSVIPID